MWGVFRNSNNGESKFFCSFEIYLIKARRSKSDIDSVLDKAPGNNAPLGGIKVSANSGWFAARPSGTEDIYKIYAESFCDDAHLRRILDEAQSIVDTALNSISSRETQ